MKQLAYYDGAFLPLDTYAVHLEDRGFQFGDGVFETIRVYDGKCFALKEHLERYRRSMRELSMPRRQMSFQMPASGRRGPQSQPNMQCGLRR